MGGSDTIRGINFQHACAILKALEILEQGNAAAIGIESSADIVDFELLDANGNRFFVAQAKSRSEPYTWGDNELIQTIEEWAALEDENIREYVFFTDGQVGRRNKVANTLETIRTTEDPSQSRILLESAGLANFPLLFLKRLLLKTRYGELQGLLDTAKVKLLRLLELRQDPSVTKAQSLLDRLFLEFSMAGGRKDPQKRLFTRKELSELLEIPLDVIDERSVWSSALNDLYLEKVMKNNKEDSIVNLSTKQISGDTFQFFSVKDFNVLDTQKNTSVDVISLLSQKMGAALFAHTGGGKTSALRLLASECAAKNQFVILYLPEISIEGSLEANLRETVEDTIGALLTPDFLDTALSRENSTILIDGLTELPPNEQRALRKDLIALRKKFKCPRIIVSGRHVEGLRRLPFPIFELLPLDPSMRQKIAGRVLPAEQRSEANLFCRRLEQDLGSLVDNPLLFVMSLMLFKNDIRPGSKSEVYDHFVPGIFGRADSTVDFDIVVCVMALVCIKLLVSGRYRQPHYSWVEMARDGLRFLNEEQLFDTSKYSGDSIISELEKCGMLEKVSHTQHCGLLHDSFRDYFCSIGIHRFGELFPQHITQDWEEALVFYGEAFGVDFDLASRSVQDNLILALRLSAIEKRIGLETAIEDLQYLLGTLLQKHFCADAIEKLGLKEVKAALFCSSYRNYISLIQNNEPQVFTDINDFETASREATIILSINQDCGPLRLLRKIWRELLDALLGRMKPTLPRAIPEEREALASEVKAVFNNRKKHLKKIANLLCPSIAARVISSVGWNGFDARILPPATRKGRFPRERDHTMFYRRTGEGVNVLLAETRPESPEWKEYSVTSAESFIEGDEASEAVREFRRAVNRITDMKDLL